MNLVLDEVMSEESVSANYETGTSCSLEDYLAQPDHSMDARIARAREQLGATTILLGHHYQRDEVVRFADYTGDSYKLSRITADSDAKYIVFCGVHFMAESADVLGTPEQQVILPDLNAGCSMADMAEISQVEACWRALEAAGVAEDTIPLTYMNSTAAIKAFCGERGGLVCTSSNARAAFEWAFARKKRILFLPDQHLGRNTGYAMGISLNDMTVWDPWAVQLGGNYGGSTKAALEKSKIILWKGHCAVHQRFLPSHVDQLRAKYPGLRVIVHPECRWEVCQKADAGGAALFAGGGKLPDQRRRRIGGRMRVSDLETDAVADLAGADLSGGDAVNHGVDAAFAQHRGQPFGVDRMRRADVGSGQTAAGSWCT